MGLAQDLLQQASHLATYEGASPSQAGMRRAVSTAYYALFHLLIEDAAQRWQGSSEARTGIERGFDHGPMYRTCVQFQGPVWKDWQDHRQPVPPALRKVAKTFVLLQDERHAADYDNHERWTLKEVQAILDLASAAFQNWQVVRNDRMAGNYLLAMLVKKPRS